MSQQPPRTTEPRTTSNDRDLIGPRIGFDLEDNLDGRMRLALHDFVEAEMACEWCVDQCIDESPEMAECVRLCRDVADLAGQNVRFLARDSAFGAEIAETFADAAEACARECERHPHAHCQECANVLYRAADSTWAMLEQIDRQHGRRGAEVY